MTEMSKSQPDAQEPSMEDILASIRRILAEDGGSPEEEEPAPAPKKSAPATLEAEPEAAPPAAPIPKMAATSADAPADDFDAAGGVTDPFGDVMTDAQPAMDEVAVEFDTPPPARSASRKAAEPPIAEAADPPFAEDIFVLSPQMRTSGHTLVSDVTAADSTDVLSQLARAILDRRDMAVTTRDITLESIVREMLRPLLREWLDRNLPYLIERLVKKEIDLMINRAERLED